MSSSIIGQMSDLNLPSSVVQLDCPNGSKVYLVGTAHFSLESIEDVRRTIAAVKPKIVLVELCRSRKLMLMRSDEEILREARTMTLAKMKNFIRREGLLAGIAQSLYLKFSAELTQQLGVAPGGEFRAGYEEAVKINADIHLGDRLVGITFKRAIATLSLWQKIRLAFLVFRMLTSKFTINPEEVERMRSRDVVQVLLGDLDREFPSLAEVLVRERDRILTYSLMASANCSTQPFGPPVTVVGIVGMGHIDGICANWMLVGSIRPLLVIPESSRAWRIACFALKVGFRIGIFTLVLATAYGVTRLYRQYIENHGVNRGCHVIVTNSL